MAAWPPLLALAQPIAGIEGEGDAAGLRGIACRIVSETAGLRAADIEQSVAECVVRIRVGIEPQGIVQAVTHRIVAVAEVAVDAAGGDQAIEVVIAEVLSSIGIVEVGDFGNVTDRIIKRNSSIVPTR